MISSPPVLVALENESIEILRETPTAFRKALAPGPMPFPLMQIDTSWKLKEIISFRGETAKEVGFELIAQAKHDGIKDEIDPFSTGASMYTGIMKTVALRAGLDIQGFDAAIGGWRRDEERSRAKERIFSVREPGHRWEPRTQRPELWRTYNPKLATYQTMRIFPLSHWTELDVWNYVLQDNIKVSPLNFAKERPIVWRGNRMIMVDDKRYPLKDGET